jgi:hypothetical protein
LTKTPVSITPFTMKLLSRTTSWGECPNRLKSDFLSITPWRVDAVGAATETNNGVPSLGSKSLYVGPGGSGTVNKDLHELKITRSRATDSLTVQVHSAGTLMAILKSTAGQVVHVYHDAPVTAGQSVAVPLSLPESVAPGLYKLEVKQGSTERVITLEK